MSRMIGIEGVNVLEGGHFLQAGNWYQVVVNLTQLSLMHLQPFANPAVSQTPLILCGVSGSRTPAPPCSCISSV